MMSESINERIAQHRPGRAGIADWATRHLVHLMGKREAAEALPAGAWRDSVIKVIEAQLVELDNELARLPVVVIEPRTAP